VSVSMDHAEREAFLADVHVGVLTVVAGAGRGPLATPVWYSYRPGGPVAATSAVSMSQHSCGGPGQPRALLEISSG
jgi:nitroimidazol reductase NimA-like FMN-containing flavoprotein (pyridoxamine 5'-phosphate oxidase superfamily)